ncbi:MAG TPA: hypothetical protein VGG83_30540 [Trebonia sp.]|jgi:hypothetical protein
MNPQLLSSLAAERRRDLAPAVTAASLPAARTAGRAHPTALPKFRVSWTRTTLAAVAGSRRGRSVVIVISATRTS